MKLILSKLLHRKAYWLLEAAGLLVIGLSLAACTQGNETLAVGDPAPDFSASTAAGGTVSLSDFKNEQPVLLFFHMAVG